MALVQLDSLEPKKPLALSLEQVHSLVVEVEVLPLEELEQPLELVQKLPRHQHSLGLQEQH